MSDCWATTEISRMSKAGRIATYIWLWLIVGGWIVATVMQAVYGHYGDATAEAVVFGWLFLTKWVWPLWVARSVRRRGGKFGTWYAASIILGLLIPGIVYLAGWSHKPILDGTEPLKEVATI